MLLLALLIAPALAWPELGPDGVPTGGQVVAAERFVPGTLPDAAVVSDAGAVGAVAAATLEYLAARPPDPAVGAGLFGELGVDLGRVERTLAFVAKVAAEDAGSPRNRLQDAVWLAEHFEVLDWQPDTAGAAARDLAPPTGHIRLTRYLVYQVEGRPRPEAPYTHALYAPPPTPTAWTRQQAMSGALEAAGVAEPLVYLTEEGVYQALMQGTIEVSLPDGAVRTFNVHVHNDRAYDPQQRDPAQQARYWYFRQVDGPLGWGDIPLAPRVAVAGDIYNLGLGKVVALETVDATGQPVLELAVLADTGGAFQPNLFQLDHFTGAHADHAAFQAATGHVPPYVRARVLLLRE